MEPEHPFSEFPRATESVTNKVRRQRAGSRRSFGMWFGASLGAFVGAILGTFCWTGLTGMRETMIALGQGFVVGAVIGFLVAGRAFTLQNRSELSRELHPGQGCQVFLVCLLGLGMAGAFINLLIHLTNVDNLKPGTVRTALAAAGLGTFWCAIAGRWLAALSDVNEPDKKSPPPPVPECDRW